jgi:hypothetical protein
MSLSDVRLFIDKAKEYSMPVSFLIRLVNEFDFDFETGEGTDHVAKYWVRHDELVLYENTWKGLTRPHVDSSTVDTLYHEGTHAYIDLDDYDETQEFGRAIQYYVGAQLEKGYAGPAFVIDEREAEGAAQEAAAMYVGYRASTVWSTWRRLEIMRLIVKNVLDGKETAARAIDVLNLTSRPTVANEYGAAMQKQVFGYVQRGDDQIPIANKAIYTKLSDYCDRTILDNRISDHFDHTLALKVYFDSVYQMALKFPELAQAMIRGSGSLKLQP